MLNYGLLIAAGLAGLFLGGRWLVKSSARLASSFGVSTLVIGLTVVAWATSAPEFAVNLSAALQGEADIALGNVLGSNVVNIGLALSLMALLYTVTMSWQLTRREIPIMVGISVLLLVLALDGVLNQWDGLVLLGIFMGFSALVYILIQRERQPVTASFESLEKQEHLVEPGINRLLEVGRFVVGLVALILGANWLIEGGTGAARLLGISEFVIGLTIVAVGTSLPEIASSLIAAQQGETDIAVGNIVGSNIANITLILGMTALITPVNVAQRLLVLEIPVMIAFAAFMLIYIRRQRVERWQAAVLLLAYGGFLAVTVSR